MKPPIPLCPKCQAVFDEEFPQAKAQREFWKDLTEMKEGDLAPPMLFRVKSCQAKNIKQHDIVYIHRREGWDLATVLLVYDDGGAYVNVHEEFCSMRRNVKAEEIELKRKCSQ